ncbi:MAG: TetR/AcrR family transcriptional regulator [Candidatus Lokiarchaeota archaeon]|nr:TetR/AcrR family transcriptional regulator [Candidatus Lokiarchaeota archaeon]
MSSREKKSEIIKKEKRDLFIISALTVFEEKGFNNTRIKDITKRANTSVGNFYNYFNSKEDVIEVLISGLAELMISKFRELFIYFKDNKIPPISAVKNLFRGYAKMFREKKDSFLIFFEQMGGMDQKYRNKRNEILDNFTNEVEKIISRLVESGARDQNPKITARVWTSTVLGVFIWWIRSDFELEEEELIENLTEVLVKGTMSN